MDGITQVSFQIFTLSKVVLIASGSYATLISTAFLNTHERRVEVLTH